MIARAAKLSPLDGGPSLLPKKVFADILENNRLAIIRDYVSSTRRQQTVFHDIMDMWGQPDEGGLGGRYVKPWQGAFCAIEMADVLNLGFGEWEPVARWFLDPMLKRATKGAGWNRAYPCNYQDVIAARRPTTASDDNCVGSYAEAWALTKAAMGFVEPASDVLGANQDYNYLANLRAVFAWWSALSPEARACYDWLHPLLKDSPWGVDIQLCIAPA
jgi:hypothetical protein